LLPKSPLPGVGPGDAKKKTTGIYFTFFRSMLGVLCVFAVKGIIHFCCDISLPVIGAAELKR
jgi:hypothetical protein